MRYYIYKTNNNYTKPLTREKIESLIKTSELSIDEFIFITDTKEWKRIFDLDEFSKSILKPEAHEIKKWFTYNKESKKQTGPFSTKEIILKLSKQKISENTYLWSYETKEWARLKEIDDFNKKTQLEIKRQEQKKEKTNKQKIEKVNEDKQKNMHVQSVHEDIRIVNKQSPRLINKKQKEKKKNQIITKNHRLSFLPEIFFGAILIIIGYIERNNLHEKIIYFYVIGSIFILFVFILYIKRKKKNSITKNQNTIKRKENKKVEKNENNI